MVYTGLYSADIFLLSLADDLQNHSTDSIQDQIDLSGPPAFTNSFTDAPICWRAIASTYLRR
jgi:hypothetical protein